MDDSRKRDSEKDTSSQETEEPTSDNVPENEEEAEVTEILSSASKDDQKEDSTQKELLYLKAEFENFKRRVLREQTQAIELGNEKFIAQLVPVVALFDRAFQSSGSLTEKLAGHPAQKEMENFLTGIKMTQQELVNVLSRFGVEFIGTVGEKFDPAKHEAISQKETSADKVDTVMEVFQKGCSLKGRLLKPAMVVVGTSTQKD